MGAPLSEIPAADDVRATAGYEGGAELIKVVKAFDPQPEPPKE